MSLRLRAGAVGCAPWHGLSPGFFVFLSRLFVFFAFCVCIAAAHAGPLRVFIHAGQKTDAADTHEHERFLSDWKSLLADRGINADGALDWPTPEQFQNTDVIIVYAQSGSKLTNEQERSIAEFTRRGGGIVAIQCAAMSNDPAWWKSVVGGAWVPNVSKSKEWPMDIFFTENQRLGGGHPITRGASNFHLEEEIYYDMDLAPGARVLATAFSPKVHESRRTVDDAPPSLSDIQPQMWSYEKDKYRAVVCNPGHFYATFSLPNFRAIFLRSIAWVGQRANIDEYCRSEEIAALPYPPGGPRRPEDTVKALEVHPDFTVQLVASEPLISKPINFDWDPKGRLWVAETPEYPNGRHGMRSDYAGKEWKDHGGVDPSVGWQTRRGLDKISILVDTNGDGIMDRKRTFCEDLELVTGFVFYKDGVIVTQSPDILWVRDTDGDGKADKVEKLFTGLGNYDTHAVINNPRWGWDGWIYATHGYSESSKVKNARGQLMPKIGSGVVRFKPDGSMIEQYSSKSGNTWGLEITGDNRVMWTQPTSGTVLNQTILPEYALARGAFGGAGSYHNIVASPKTFPAMPWEQQVRRQGDHTGDFTSAAGCVIYDGGTWPAEYNGDYFVAEPTINIVHHERLTPQGASYTAHKLPGREETEFIRSTDTWWLPIEVRVGPDGAVYIADFYNQAVSHNDSRVHEHNRVNAAVRPDRDHYFGRIWRLDHKNSQPVPVPNLSKATPDQLVAALAHPNRVVRMTASRLLVEGGVAPKELLTALPEGKCELEIATLWTLFRLNALDGGKLAAMVSAKAPAFRRNVLQIAEECRLDPARRILLPGDAPAPVVAAIGDPDPTVRVAALRAVAAGEVSGETAKRLADAWPKFDDDFQKSAAVGAAMRNPAATIVAALDSAEPELLAPLVATLAGRIGEKNDVVAAAKLIDLLADKPVSADPLKRRILDALGQSLKDAPPMTPELAVAFDKLLAGGVGASALPLAAKWDKAGVLKGAVARLTAAQFRQLHDAAAPDGERLAAAESLLGSGEANTKALRAVLVVVTAKSSPALQRQLITTLAKSRDARVGSALCASFGQLSPEAQGSTFEILLQRPEWALALIDAVKAGKVDIHLVGPAGLARLRTYPNKEVALRANNVLDELFGPALKAKNEVIAKLTPEVQKPGDAVRGKALFTTTCAICHKLDNLGADIGPALTGMGAHGPAELLVPIVDPNREVDPSFTAWNIETKNGQNYAGIIARENPSTIVLKSLAGVQEINVSDIKSRVNTGRSLMPEGFEGLGAENLRDLLAFICGGEAQRFRMVDLKSAFTADSRQTVFNWPKALKGDALPFKNFGSVTFDGIPFLILDPVKSLNGNNVVILKGGPKDSLTRTLPQRVEARLGGFKANRLCFLGAVNGWGINRGGNAGDVLKVTVEYSDGQTEVFVCKNGIEFADDVAGAEAPGSKATNLVDSHQLRFFRKQLQRTAPIDKLVLESFDTDAAPATVAITAELDDSAPAPSPVNASPAPETE